MCGLALYFVSLQDHVFSFTADSVAENMVGVVSFSKEVNKLRKVQMTWCVNLPPFLIAIIYGDLCRNSLEELEVTNQGVSFLSVCLTCNGARQYTDLSPDDVIYR